MSIVHIAFYPSDWLAGTRGLSAEETGVYITLICRMYEMAGPIERDDNRLHRLCGTKSKAAFVKALEYLIDEGKIIATKNVLINDRVQKEIKNSTTKSSKAKAAAQARWDKKPNKNNGRDNASAPPEHMPPECYPEPEPLDDDEDAGARPRDLSFREKILTTMGHDKTGLTATGQVVGGQADMIDAGRWQSDLGLTEPEVLAVVAEITAKRQGQPPPNSLRYFNEPMREFAGRKNAEPLTPKLTAIPGGQHGKSQPGQHSAIANEIAERFLDGRIKHDPLG